MQNIAIENANKKESIMASTIYKAAVKKSRRENTITRSCEGCSYGHSSTGNCGEYGITAPRED